MLRLYCGDPEVARDLAQEALTRAWVHWRKVRRMDRPDLWVRRVALNLANSHFRRISVCAIRQPTAAPLGRVAPPRDRGRDATPGARGVDAAVGSPAYGGAAAVLGGSLG
ncbi:MAG: sigma factor [Nocardioidaceae bacterium]